MTNYCETRQRLLRKIDLNQHAGESAQLTPLFIGLGKFPIDKNGNI
jgi:hypothetical protein